jgi:cytochrome c oxidase subunit 2
LKTRTILSWGGAAAFLLALGGAAMAQGTPQDSPGVWLPFSASDYSEDIDFLYRVIFWVTTGMFLLTEGLLLAFCVIYRRRPGHRPTYTHGNNVAEITWTVIPALMLVGLAVWQIPTWNAIKKRFPKEGEINERTNRPYPAVTTVDMLGEQYKWNVRYPGTKAKYKGDYDYTNLSNVHIPLGNAAFFNLRSKDVIHSVFIPHMRVKQDTVPGLRQKLWFQPNRMFLVDLKAPKQKTGEHIYVQENNEWVKKEQEIQPKRFVYLDNEEKEKLPKDEYFQKGEAFLAKDFAPGGKLYDKKIAVQGHYEKDNVYQVPVINGVAKKVRVLYQGKITDGQFADCEYAQGVYEIACAELCGMGHYTMRAFLHVEPAVVYESWLKSEMEDVSEPPPAWKFWRD